jgi:regulatory protein YycI of two-component signal transduction system YycFG
MRNKILILLILQIVLLSSSVSAQNNRTNVLLTLKDFNTNEDINNVAVYINLDEEDVDQYVSDILKLKLDDGRYKAVIRVDDLSTPGNDYFKKTELAVENNLIQAVFLYPVGTVKGIVKDKLDNIVGNAELKFECSPNPEIDFPSKTDKFGGFYANFVPVGRCRIFAGYKDAIGFEEINVSRGSLEDIEINLDKSILVAKRNIFIDIFAVLAIVLAIIFLAVYLKKKPARISEKKEVKKEGISKRSRDIMQTLNEKEKKIINYLIEHEYKGKKHVGIQSVIRRETGIPRTSLARIIKSLQIKKIIEVEKIGKAIKIKLTDWFIGKEEMGRK